MVAKEDFGARLEALKAEMAVLDQDVKSALVLGNDEKAQQLDDSDDKLCNWKAGCMFEERDYVLKGGWNNYHFVTIANPSGDGVNFTWKNKAGVNWAFTANKYSKTGNVQGFYVHNDCPYYSGGFKKSKVMYSAKTKQVKGVFGPGGEYYTLV